MKNSKNLFYFLLSLLILLIITAEILCDFYNKSREKPVTKTEMQICLEQTESNGSDEDCEWCDYLLQDDCRVIDTVILQYEGEPLFGVGFTDGTGLDFLNLYEFQQIVKHSKSNI